MLDWFEILDQMRAGFSVSRLESLMDHLLQGNAKAFADGMEKYLCQLVSSHDTANKESFYHGLLLGMTALFLNDYIIESNRESGYGRFDLAIFPKVPGKSGVLMEFKAAGQDTQLKAKAEEALRQIENQQYCTEFEKRGIRHIWRYGIAFCGKKLMLLKG